MNAGGEASMGDTQRGKSFAKQFKDTYYPHDDSVKLLISGNGHEYMQVEDPLHLASFVAFCSRSGQRVFLRGETEFFPNSVPSLFRNDCGSQCDESELQKRWSVYMRFLDELRGLSGDRWQTENLGAVLQHYGIRTPWLDVVHNIYTAVWFATHDLKQGHCESHKDYRVDCPRCQEVCCRGLARRSCQDYGWISLYAEHPICSPERPCSNRELIAQDIPCEQSSRHLRPHAQQALSLAMQGDKCRGPSPLQNFDDFRIAHVLFPNSEEWALLGHMFSTHFLFPSSELDDSLRQLSEPVAQDILNSACKSVDLGTISHYA